MTDQEVFDLVIAEMTEKSGININTNATKFIQMCGPNATVAPGCYCIGQWRRGKWSEEILHFVIKNQPDRILEVLFHEIAHATGLRLGRIMEIDHSESLYAREEVIAETTAQILINHFGLMTDDIQYETNDYIDAYKYTVDMILATELAQKAAEYILENWLPDFNSTCQQRKAA